MAILVAVDGWNLEGVLVFASLLGRVMISSLSDHALACAQYAKH